MAAVGAVPIRVSIVEIYSVMEKGITDCYALDFQGTGNYRLWEVANYFTPLNFYSVPFYTVMNLHKWNSLPSDIQNQIMSVSGMKGSVHFGAGFDMLGYTKLLGPSV